MGREKPWGQGCFLGARERTLGTRSGEVEFYVHCVILGSPRTILDDLNRESGNQTRLTDLKMATGNTRLLHLVVKEVM